MKTIKEKIEEITDEYGALHEPDCDLNSENGSYDGCDCAMKGMIAEVARVFTEYFSHDITFKDEEQRKAAVEMYLQDFLTPNNKRKLIKNEIQKTRKKIPDKVRYMAQDNKTNARKRSVSKVEKKS